VIGNGEPVKVAPPSVVTAPTAVSTIDDDDDIVMIVSREAEKDVMNEDQDQRGQKRGRDGGDEDVTGKRQRTK